MMNCLSMEDLDLPNEVLVLIFSYLNASDKVKACLVCKRWKDLINTRTLLKDISITIDSLIGLQVFSLPSRKFINYIIKNIHLDDACCNIIRKLSPYVESLHFKDITMSEEQSNFANISFTKLKTLIADHCDVWSIFHLLPNLEHLHFINECSVNDAGFMRILASTTCLTALTIPQNTVFHSMTYNRFYPKGKTFESYPSTFISSYPTVKHFIIKYAKSLKYLGFSFTLLTASAISEISEISNLKLHKIDLSNCFECENGLIHFFKNQPSLVGLKLSGYRYLKDDACNAISYLLPNLKELEIKYCIISDSSLKKVFQLQNLKILDLQSCDGFTQDGLKAAISDMKCFQLSCLNLSRLCISNITDILFEKCIYLENLDLSFTDIQNDDIHLISSRLLKLKYLNLRKCPNISDYGIIGCELENKQSLSNLKYLKILILQDCLNITSEAIASLKFQYLEYLNISGCSIEDNCDSKALVTQNPSLIKLCWEWDIMVPRSCISEI